MAWTNRASNSAIGDTTTLAVTAGDLIVILCGFVASSGGSASDGVNTYTTQFTGNLTGTNGRAEVYIASAIAVSTTTLTITATAVCDSVHAACFYHGGDTPVATADVTGTANDVMTKDLTTSVANTLLVGISDCSGTPAVGTGFTQIGAQVSSFKITTEFNGADNSAGTNTVYFTGGSPDRGIAAAAFKYTAGGGDTVALGGSVSNSGQTTPSLNLSVQL